MPKMCEINAMEVYEHLTWKWSGIATLEVNSVGFTLPSKKGGKKFKYISMSFNDGCNPLCTVALQSGRKINRKYFHLSNYSTAITILHLLWEREAGTCDELCERRDAEKVKRVSGVTQYGALQLAIIYFGTVTTDQKMGTINRNAMSISCTKRKKQCNSACSKTCIWHSIQLSLQLPLPSWGILLISHYLSWITNSTISVTFDSYSVELAQIGPAKPLPKKDASLLLHINYRENIVCFVKCNCYVTFTGCILHSKWNNCWNKLMESVFPLLQFRMKTSNGAKFCLAEFIVVLAWLEDAPLKIQCILALNGLRQTPWWFCNRNVFSTDSWA